MIGVVVGMVVILLGWVGLVLYRRRSAPADEEAPASDDATGMDAPPKPPKKSKRKQPTDRLPLMYASIPSAKYTVENQ